jgi:hypothetical protein
MAVSARCSAILKILANFIVRGFLQSLLTQEYISRDQVHLHIDSVASAGDGDSPLAVIFLPLPRLHINMEILRCCISATDWFSAFNNLLDAVDFL